MTQPTGYQAQGRTVDVPVFTIGQFPVYSAVPLALLSVASKMADKAEMALRAAQCTGR